MLGLGLHVEQLLGKPLGGLLRGIPSRFEVLLNVGGRKRVDDLRREIPVVGLETDFHQAAALQRFDVEVFLELGQELVVDVGVARNRSGERENLRRGSGLFLIWRRSLRGSAEFSNAIEPEQSNTG